jgi:DNA-binding Lrp family transcriptional regulator
MDSEQINGLVERLSGRGREAREIADVTGLSPAAVQKRLERLRAAAVREAA